MQPRYSGKVQDKLIKQLERQEKQQAFQQDQLRVPATRNSPPSLDRERDRPAAVEAQLQEAAKSGLAHANARIGAPHEGGKPPEYQTLVA